MASTTTDSSGNLLGHGTPTPHAQSQEAPAASKKPSKLKKAWQKIGLDAPTLIPMIKLSLPAIIAFSMYQSDPVANEYNTLDYLVAIISILSLCILPRAKFLQNMILNCIGLGLAAAFTLLAMYCSTQARAHTTKADAPKAPPNPDEAQILQVPYNSSSSVVCAIWLFFEIYLANCFRGAFPQFNISAIIFCIYTVVALTEAPHIPTMTASISFNVRLLKTFTTGYALATGVHFVVFPVTSRTVIFKEMTGYFGVVKKVLKAQSAYIKSLEDTDMFVGSESGKSETNVEDKKRAKPSPDYKTEHFTETTEAKQLRAAVQALSGLHVKIRGDLPFAKREVAFGKLDGTDLESIYRGFRKILLPILGMSTISDIFSRVALRQGWAASSESDEEISSLPRTVSHSKETEVEEWNKIVTELYTPFESMVKEMIEGLDHAMIMFGFVKPPKRTKLQGHNGPGEKDVEAGAVAKPGDEGFSNSLEKRIDEFYEGREVIISRWCEMKGLHFPMESPPPEDPDLIPGLGTAKDKYQLWMILYIEHLLFATARAVLDLDRLADSKAKRQLGRFHLISPGKARLKKWLVSILTRHDTSPDHDDFDNNEAALPLVDLGDSFKKPKDLEHLPPTNILQRLGTFIRIFPDFFASPESAYGFRAAVATMSIGILAYLRPTSRFFIEQRVLWALIMLSISMTMTAGSSVFGFFGRVAGTAIAMVASYVNWYIVDGKTPGVIVFLYVFLFIETYFMIKFPRMIIVVILSMVTQVLIIGYELEYVKIGPVLLSSGQKYYPIYLLAPFRLATVLAGMFAAFVWTIFPYPITAKSQLRHSLGKSLFLLANYYSCVHTTVVVRLQNIEGDMTKSSSPGKKLEKFRLRVFAKCLILVNSLNDHNEFTKWEPSLGGKFPREHYALIIKDVERILRYIALIGYATESFADANKAGSGWIENFRSILGDISVTTTEITSLLSLLSNSVSNGQPLPPYLKLPKPYQIGHRLRAADSDILGINHILEPGYSAFTVMQISAAMIHDDMCKLTNRVQQLVGVVDFSFHVLSTDPVAEQTPQEATWKEANERKNKSD